MYKIFVTGANGFIGSALCRELCKRGIFFVSAVRNKTAPSQLQIDDLAGDPDYSDTLAGCDTVVHLAARVHVMKDNTADPMAEFLKTNLHGTVSLAQHAARANVKRFIYVSSIKVNGECTPSTVYPATCCKPHAFAESDPPNPQDPYGISKWQAEQALRRIAQETGLEVVIVRPPLVYGPGVKGNFISLLSAINKGIPLPLAGVSNMRSLVFVENLVDALIACASHPAAAGKTYLVSDGEAISTAMLAEKIAYALGRKNRSFYFPPHLLRAASALLKRSEQANRLLGSLCVNDEKIRNELSWSPPYSMEQGLSVTADWYLNEQARKIS